MPEPATRTIELGGGRYAPTAARVALDVWSPLSGLAEYQHVRLLASELVADSVLHRPGEVEVGLELVVSLSPRVIRVELRGPGASLGWDPLGEDPEQTSGWRLYLLTSLAQRWGMDRTGGVRVWFEIDRGTAAEPYT
ncbi:MAG: ATP-binding protein [Actinomycetota bacterium]|nr:ATP-binding protein [Actinomycetota bacterium]